MTTQSTEARPIAAWMKVLEQIETTLARQMALVEEVAPPSAAKQPARTPLHVLDERLGQMQARLNQAERDAAVTDAALRTEGEAYQRWADGMTMTRRKLSDWASRVR